MTSQTGVRDELLHAGVRLLDDHGPDALQTRKVAAAAGTSTMAVYTHFGGMRGLIAAIAEEGLRQFDVALTVPQTAIRSPTCWPSAPPTGATPSSARTCTG